jgi:hypothetical protein
MISQRTEQVHFPSISDLRKEVEELRIVVEDLAEAVNALEGGETTGDRSWLDQKIEAVQNVVNSFTPGSKRWKRHEWLLRYGESLVIREYSRLLVEDEFSIN